VRRRVRLVEGAGERAHKILDGEQFDAVLCHGVLPYLEDPYPLIRALATVARPGAVVSVLAKNASALAVRPALEGRYKDALAAFDADRDLGRLGAVTRGDMVAGLCRLFERDGVEPLQWYGVRVFTDHLGDRLPDANLPDIVRLEWEAGRRDPYRHLARLIHLIGRRTPH
jgi:S-adenosylmethionine-dependent methyltransferase